MGELWSIIQGHLDQYGVREAAFARRMGTGPQTINAWKVRGLKRLPERHLLEAVARETGTPYGVVLQAALVDTGYAATVTTGAAEPSLPEPAPAPSPSSSAVHVPEPEDNIGVATRPAHGPDRSRVADAASTRQHGRR